jgi:membrane associated rhomboid family serine protease
MTNSVPEHVEPPTEEPTRFQRMAPVVQLLALTLVLAHVARILLPQGVQEQIIEALAVNPSRLLAWSGNPIQSPPEALIPAIGHMFVHGGMAPIWFGFLHVFFNTMLILQAGEMVGARLGRDARGVRDFLILFLGSGVAGAGLYVALNWGRDISAIGASGAACGLFAAYLMAARSDWRAAIADPAVRSAGFWFLFFNVGVAFMASAGGVLPIAWEAHLGGFIGGAVLYALVSRRAERGPWG